MKQINDYSALLRERIFPRVQKPSRYMGGEWNQIVKNPEEISTRVLLAFPDVYEIGVSYLGFRILYELLNKQKTIFAERVYSPWHDAEALLREEKIPLCSLETSTPLSQFDIVGITLQHEMSYTNILNLVDLGQVAIEARLRQESDPLIIGGGPSASNPEPLAAFFDLMVLGDGEDVFQEIIAQNLAMKDQPRHARIEALGKLPGVYAPAFYQPNYSEKGELLGMTVSEGMPEIIHRRVTQVSDMPQKPLVPYLGVTHDRVTAELFRGCARGCRFCQAGMINRPVRERSAKDIMDQIMAALEDTGYDEASMTSLSSGDYTQLLPLIRHLMARLSQERIALSFPSLRLDSFRTELAETVRQVRKTGLTFAPEAGSERLRRVINKSMDEEGFTHNLGKVFAEGWDLVKLYFMIGLPTEQEEDITAIAQLVHRIMIAAKQSKKGRRAPRVNLSVNVFIPKPHTPFQWEPQIPISLARQRLEQLAKTLPKSAGFRLGARTEEELNRGYLEGVLARGDRKLWPVICRVWQAGARFDSWGDEFKFERWAKAFEEEGIEPDSYVLRERSIEEYLPWQHLDMGVTITYLKKERERSRQEQVTPDCRLEHQCNVCGADDPTQCPKPDAESLLGELPTKEAATRPERERVRFRLQYEKTGDIRFVGHLDLVNLFRRAARRAGLPLHYSVGFHPQPALAFGPPLPLGVSGLQEWADIGLDRWVDPEQLPIKLNAKLPAGVRITKAQEIPLATPALNSQINRSDYAVVFPALSVEQVSRLADKINCLTQAEPIMRSQWSKKGSVEVNLCQALEKITLAGDASQPTVRFQHVMGQPRTAKIPTVMAYLSEEIVPVWQVLGTRLASGKEHNNQVVAP